MKFFNNKNIISQKLAMARDKESLSQEQLAAKMQVLGVSIDQQTISRIEKNKRIVTDYEILCFCKILKIHPQDIIGNYDEFHRI